jgi:glycosyltransferase involved in cell wall biosynthesis
MDSPSSIARYTVSRGVSIRGFAGHRLTFAFALASELKHGGYSGVVVGHINLALLAITALASRLAAQPYTILVAHGIEVWSGIGALRRRVLGRFHRILCVSSYTRNRLLEQAPALLSERLKVFPNSLAESWARVAPPTSRRELPRRFILSVTRLEPGDRDKGIATVIEALGLMQDCSLQYLVAGSGRDIAFLQSMAKHFGVAERVHFLGNLDDTELVDLYKHCEAFVLPSRKEGFGIVYLEAMFFGAPVIAAHEKGVIDVVKDGETGLTVRFGDSRAIRDAIERLSADPSLRQYLCSNGRASVIDDGDFTFTQFVRRCSELFGLDEAVTRM